MKLSLDEIVTLLFDQGTFTEINADFENGGNTLVGSGNMQGRLTYLIADRMVDEIAKDFSARFRKKGNFVRMVAAKPAPIVVVLDYPMAGGDKDRAGVILSPGLTRAVMGRDGLGYFLSEFTQISGMVPTIGILIGNVAAGSAFIAPMCDALVLIEGRNLSIARAIAVEKITGKKVRTEDLSGAEMHCSVSGLGDAFARNEHQAIDWAKRFLSYFPDSYLSRPNKLGFNAPDPDSLVVEDGERIFETKRAFDVRRVIKSLVDEGSFLEYKELYAQELTAGFARIEGQAIGVVANNSIHKFGALFPKSCKKMSRFISLCDSFNIPLVFLADTPGFMPDLEVERDAIVKHGSLVLSILSEARVPKLSIILRKAYSGGIFAMSGPGFATKIFELPKATLGPIGLDVIREPQTQAEKDARDEYDAMSDPKRLRDLGYIDEVVEWHNLRSTIVRALNESSHTKRTAPKRVVFL